MASSVLFLSNWKLLRNKKTVPTFVQQTSVRDSYAPGSLLECLGEQTGSRPRLDSESERRKAVLGSLQDRVALFTSDCCHFTGLITKIHSRWLNYSDIIKNKELTLLKKHKPQSIKPECKGRLKL